MEPWTPEYPPIQGRFAHLDDWRQGCCELGSLSEATLSAIREALKRADFVLILGNTGSGKSSLATALADEDGGFEMFDEIREVADFSVLAAGLLRGRVLATSHVADPSDVRTLLDLMTSDSGVFADRTPYLLNLFQYFDGQKRHRHLVAMGPRAAAVSMAT